MVTGRRPVNAGADEQAVFARWVRPHWRSMELLARRLSPPGEAEDVLQDALAAAWRLRARYDPQRGEPRSWLLTLVADHARRHRRQSGRRPIADDIGDFRDLSAVPAPEPDERLLAAVQSLPARQRTAVELHYFLDLPILEVAQVMGCRVGTVKSTLFSARERLAELLNLKDVTG